MRLSTFALKHFLTEYNMIGTGRNWAPLATAALFVSLATYAPGHGQAPSVAAQDKGSFLLTVFLRHDQSKTLPEINERLKQNGYYTKFPPEGIDVASWYVMMGIGQVVTLRVPAERVREVNRVIEETAWGGYRTEFYPTYDYKAVAEQQRKAAQ
jgi:hypothetical protein